MNRKLLFGIILLTAITSVVAVPPEWIDLPLDNYANLSKMEHNNFNTLNEIIQRYHSIDKQDPSLILQREIALDNVCKYLTPWIELENNLPLRKFICNIKIMANNKKGYLQRLRVRFEGDQFSEQYLKQYHMDTVNILPGYRPIFLHNCKEYDSAIGQYWGEFWIETIDPSHRQLTTFYNSWRKDNSKEHLGKFFLWLEEQNLSKDVLYLDFMSETEKNENKVLVDEGLMYFKGKIKKELIN